ncbi:MAG TPA: hypothetical protein VFU21_17280 [Kofleriaceae bacterium]|nr:hypothetical protein [Kofleriaceae bacterium]
MRTATEVEHRRPPTVVGALVNGVLPSRARRTSGEVPPLVVRWRGHRAGSIGLDDFHRSTGLARGPALHPLYLHALAFRVQFAVVTHPALPLRFWRVLQIRNHILARAEVAPGAEVDIESAVASHRVLDRGREVDLQTAVRVGGEAVWECLTTFYVRGRFGPAGAPSPRAAAPDAGDEVVARWRTGSGDVRAFARLTGDFNGIHAWSWYARRFGFERAFHHPQRALGECLAHLAPPEWRPPWRLDAWLKGPVYYGAEVELRAARGEDAVVFALAHQGATRPAIVGRVQTAAI